MKTFKLWTESRSLVPADIYNFYYICTGLSHEQINLADHNVAEFYLREIKDNYLKTFGMLLANQLKKYVSRRRVDVGFNANTINPNDYAGLRDLMQGTWRSDMKRRNEVWNAIADFTYKLSTSQSAKDICFYIDRINNSVHNTHELVLDKLGMPFLQAFDKVHRSRTPAEYAQYVSPEVRKIMKVWLGPGRNSRIGFLQEKPSLKI